MTNQYQVKNFDLSLAQQGHPLVTRDGQKAKFIAYVPEADKGQQVSFARCAEAVIYQYKEGLNK